MGPTRRASRQPPLFLAYLAVQALIVAGISPVTFPDSASYSQLSLTGVDIRLPTVPLLYKIFPDNSLREWAQVLLAAVAWWVLAAVASSVIHDRRVRIALRIVILALGVASPVASWNSAILSESASISLTALMIAGWLGFQRSVSWSTAAGAVAATLFWTFARQQHVILVLVPAAVAVVAAVRAKKERAVLAATAGALMLIAVAGFAELHRNQTVSRRNLGSIIQVQILPNAGWTRWFRSHGMPYDAEIARDAGVPFEHAPESPALVAWLSSRGTSTYLRFLLENPGFTLAQPLPYFVGEQPSLTRKVRSPLDIRQSDPTPSMLSPTVGYGRHRDVLPSVVDRLVFDQGEVGDVLVLALIVGALAWTAGRRFGSDRRLLVPLVIALSAIPQGYVVWLGGGLAVGELDRLSIVTAVSLRVGLWLLVALACDRILTQSRIRARTRDATTLAAA